MNHQVGIQERPGLCWPDSVIDHEAQHADWSSGGARVIGQYELLDPVKCILLIQLRQGLKIGKIIEDKGPIESIPVNDSNDR
jgi:hypothetical protein